MEEKLKNLCDKITQEGQAYLTKCGYSCQCNLDNAVAHYHIGVKYARVDVGGSGSYMVDLQGNIYGIKAYGVINKKHVFGNLDTISEWFWGSYKAKKI